MRVRSGSDVAATIVVWLPILAVAAGILYVLALGMFSLETISFGTEFFISNDATTNLPAPVGVTNDQLLEAASSGNLEQMEATLAQAEAQSQALATR